MGDKNPLDAIPAYWLHRYVYVALGDRFYDADARIELTRQAFSAKYAHLYEKVTAASALLRDPRAIKVDSFIYLPGEDENPVQHGKTTHWNIWRDPAPSMPVNATDADVTPWLDHLSYIVADIGERNHFLDWMAFTLKFPRNKINHAILLAGTSRVGKDMLLNPLRYGLGEENICEPPACELAETYTDYLHHSKLIIFQEIMNFEGLNLENKLKPILAAPPDTLRVRLFGRGFYETPNIVQAIFMSNYRDALHVSAGDGRYFAIWTDAQPLSPDYYSALATWLEDGGNGAVCRWLLNRDVSGFRPKAPAPSTKYKTDLVQTSKSPLRLQMEDMIAAYDSPCHVDVVRSADIARKLRDKFNPKTIGIVLGEMGAIARECRRSTGNRERLSLFAVRNFAEWEAQPAAAWLHCYDSRLSVDD